VSIFLLAPTPDILAQRSSRTQPQGGQPAGRGNRQAVSQARSEIENYSQYRYILVNDILDDAVEA